MSGYARFHRSLIGHPAFRNDAEAMAFAYMVLRASWKPTRVRYKGHAVSLNRGQLSMSQRDMAAALDRDKAWVERLWKRLRAEAMIAVTYEAGAAVITICNYEKYQASNDAREALDEAPHEADARQTQGTEQGIEEGKKEDTGGDARARPAWSCPDSVDPQHWRDFRANRRRKKLTDTDTAYAGQLRLIERFASDEWPPGRLVQHAAEKGWGTIVNPLEYETPRNGQRTSNHLNGTHGRQRRSDEIDDAAGRLGFT